MYFDAVVVGAGFTGSTIAERLASRFDQTVLIIDRRDHIGGNAYDEHNRDGILVHKYGPHIFHTNSERVWRYLSQFTEWRPYEHHVLGSVEGALVPIPFNFNTLRMLFPEVMARRLEEKLVACYGFGGRVPILKLRESDDAEVKELAQYVYKHVFESYTRKQWGLEPDELSPHVTARVPVRLSRDDRYFQDTYQAMPADGYARLFRRLLHHPNIRLMLNTDYRDIESDVGCDAIYYTGPIDEYFNYRYGPLPYRSLRFDVRTEGRDRHQPVGTVNYPCQYDYTRITEQKHLTGQKSQVTTLVYEYPRAHTPGETEPYYPIPRDETKCIYAKYRQAARKLDGKVTFCGRLGGYQYYNMDQAVATALANVERTRKEAVEARAV
ncbi:MAG TPA: UDP-galactopyranose mutase [Gammaproteobacteria bacterium]|nr:UDP-galactopyranose mutase [Gammaproteobacteria bacterium]